MTATDTHTQPRTPPNRGARADAALADLLRQSNAAAGELGDLVHVHDGVPGISRRRSGAGFRYVGPDGAPVRDPRTLQRIRALAIPPAYRDVWICPDPLGHIQATGRDDRGRKQYRYHTQWTELRDTAKYGGLVGFARCLPRLRRRFEQDLAAKGLVRTRILATVALLLDRTLIRIGNATYAKANKSFGLSTLRNRHVTVEGAKVRFKFMGKSGKVWNLALTDRRMARIIRLCQELPGQHLFQYELPDGSVQAVTSQAVNDYLREAGGPEVTAKQFRTWAGTVLAATALAREPAPTSARAAARTVNAVLDQVSARLGNTRAVCRRCYVHPAVIEHYTDGTLAQGLAQARRKRPRSPAYDSDEAMILAWLEAVAADQPTSP
ncbi:DNA topoisomerase IB [Zavarzinia sp. CC-PAN008]|uniref:DNA topoisomerase IB n=1 Tax=Zavarzinia sp. CC-PAN008 TaxID=3243332 RepID=UPI003F74AB5B